MELKMPDMMFDGATFRVTPRGFEGDGALVKLEMIPKEVDENRPTGRILFKKISKFLKSKCARSRLQTLVSWPSLLLQALLHATHKHKAIFTIIITLYEYADSLNCLLPLSNRREILQKQIDFVVFGHYSGH